MHSACHVDAEMRRSDAGGGVQGHGHGRVRRPRTRCFLDCSIVVFCVLAGLVWMRLFWLMAEQTRIAAIEQNRMSDSGSER